MIYTNYLGIVEKINKEYIKNTKNKNKNENEDKDEDENDNEYYELSSEEIIDYFESSEKRNKLHKKYKNYNIGIDSGELSWSEFDDCKVLRDIITNLDCLNGMKINYLNLEGFYRLETIDGIDNVYHLKIGKCPLLKDISSLKNIKILTISSLSCYYTKEYNKELNEYSTNNYINVCSEIKGIENLHNLRELHIDERIKNKKKLLDIGNLRKLKYVSTECSVKNIHLLKNLQELRIDFNYTTNISRFMREIVKLSKINNKLCLSVPRM